LGLLGGALAPRWRCRAPRRGVRQPRWGLRPGHFWKKAPEPTV